MVFQEFSLVPSLTVAQNIYPRPPNRMSRGLIDDREAVRQARQVFADMDVEVDPRARVSELEHRVLAAHRDRQGAGPGRPGVDHGRADGQPGPARDRGAVRADRPAEGAGHRDRLHLAPDGRGVPDRRSDHHPAGRKPAAHRAADRHHAGADRRGHRRQGDRRRDGLPGTRPRGFRRGRCSRRRNLQAGTRVQRRLLHPARGRDPRPGRADGQRPDRAGQGAVRHRLASSGEITHPRSQQSTCHSPRRAIAPGLALVPEDRRVQGLVLDHSVRENLLLPLLEKVQRGPFVADRAGKRWPRI